MAYMCLKHGALVNALDNVRALLVTVWSVLPFKNQAYFKGFTYMQWKNTPIMHAADGGHLFVVWLLLKWNADLKKSNRVRSRANAVSCLLGLRNICYFCFQFGETAMTLAKAAGKDDVHEFLVCA